jgi:hypothetical protein
MLLWPLLLLGVLWQVVLRPMRDTTCILKCARENMDR